MASFFQFLGRNVTVQYRVGDVLLPASGRFVADSGRSIFLEQHIEQRGKRNYFRWEIPYGYIHRIEDAGESEAPASDSAPAPAPAELREPKAVAAAAAQSSSGAPSILPLPHRPKTA